MEPPVLYWWMVLSQSLIYFRLIDAAASKCFYPDGSEATGDSPCNPDAEVSACCGSSSDSTCLSNSLCEDGSGRVIRGSCSDQSWSDPACPRYCLGKLWPLISSDPKTWVSAFVVVSDPTCSRLGSKTGGEDLIPCNNVTKDNVSYCCNDGIENCCNSGDGRFEVLPYPTSAIATWNSGATQFMILPGVETSTTSSTSSSSTVSSTKTVLASSTISLAPTTPLSSPSAVPDTSKGDSELSTGAKIGIGVGVAGGVVLGALLAHLFWKVHKTQDALKEQQAINSPQETRSYLSGAIMADSGLSQSHAQSYQYYKGPDTAPAPQTQPASELSADARSYELPTSYR
ncbi:hypothetical protein ANO14919_123530 [Xylariales sp. No.14919]|nr:hypothetical protein ANO14919_123530 [Xylariales sp. No.14919]